MRIAYYMPFKPLGHQHPSGDLIIGSELYRFLQSGAHQICQVSRLRLRWVYLKPWVWPVYLFHLARALRRIKRQRIDIWITYHSYYKAPDILGPACARLAGIPYIIFQGIYATKRKRQFKTWMGFVLNRQALMAADHVITNKLRDHVNLLRIVPSDRLSYVRPGIVCSRFAFDAASRKRLRAHWGCQDLAVVMCAAMLRPGVKTQGVEIVIRACAHLAEQGLDFRLVVVGDGAGRKPLEALADKLLPGRVRFVGRVPRSDLQGHFSAADIFAFPGIDESLGMVYLEAQSCGIPVVAFRDWGAKEAVVDGETGLLSNAADTGAFEANIRYLLENKAARQAMGASAAAHIREHHDRDVNYLGLESVIQHVGPGKRN
jgi:glycosyltransferase involved in cell wall biosynthesis